jgi:hypothetical protein
MPAQSTRDKPELPATRDEAAREQCHYVVRHLALLIWRAIVGA